MPKTIAAVGPALGTPRPVGLPKSGEIGESTVWPPGAWPRGIARNPRRERVAERSPLPVRAALAAWLELNGQACLLLEETCKPCQSVICSRSFARGLTTLPALQEAVAAFGFRALGGSAAFCILRSIWETNKLNGINPFETLR